MRLYAAIHSGADQGLVMGFAALQEAPHRLPAGRGLLALDGDGLVELCRGGLQGRDQIEPMFDMGQRRQEDEQHAVARLHAQGGAHESVAGFPGNFG